MQKWPPECPDCGSHNVKIKLVTSVHVFIPVLFTCSIGTCGHWSHMHCKCNECGSKFVRLPKDSKPFTDSEGYYHE